MRSCFLDRSLDRVLGNIRARPGGAQLNDAPLPGPGSGDGQEIRLAVFSLEDNAQEMIILVYYHHQTIREAGRQLGLPASQAYRLHRKALARMAGLINEGERDSPTEPDPALAVLCEADRGDGKGFS